MNYNIGFDNYNDIFIVKTSGKMSGTSFLAMARDLLNHPRWISGKNVVFDHTGLDFFGVPLADLEAIRNFHRENEKRIGSGKSAIIVSPGFVENWHKLWSRGQKIQTENRVVVFEDLKSAIQWICTGE